MERADLPTAPQPLDSSGLAAVGVAPADRPVVRAILDVYNRSNGMDFLALTALVTAPAGAPAAYPNPAALAPWPELPPLMDQPEIDTATWNLLLEVNGFGATPGESGLATLWRHLAQ